jgi:hypothetical protein
MTTPPLVQFSKKFSLKTGRFVTVAISYPADMLLKPSQQQIHLTIRANRATYSAHCGSLIDPDGRYNPKGWSDFFDQHIAPRDSATSDRARVVHEIWNLKEKMYRQQTALQKSRRSLRGS